MASNYFSIDKTTGSNNTTVTVKSLSSNALTTNRTAILTAAVEYATEVTTPEVIGVYTTAQSVSSYVDYYCLSDSSTTAPTTGWSLTMSMPTSSQPYLWHYYKVTYSDDVKSNTTSAVIGKYVNDDVSIAEIVNYYVISSSSSTLPSTSDYATTKKYPTSASPYLWSYIKTVYVKTDPMATTTVEQMYKPTLSWRSGNSVTADGGTLSLRVSSPYPWWFYSVPSNVSSLLLTTEANSYTAGTRTISIAVDSTTETDSKSYALQMGFKRIDGTYSYDNDDALLFSALFTQEGVSTDSIQLTKDSDSINIIPASGGTGIVDVTYSGSWTMASSQSGVTFYKSSSSVTRKTTTISGTGNAKVYVDFPANTAEANLIIRITATATTGEDAFVTFSQLGTGIKESGTIIEGDTTITE